MRNPSSKCSACGVGSTSSVGSELLQTGTDPSENRPTPADGGCARAKDRRFVRQHLCVDAAPAFLDGVRRDIENAGSLLVGLIEQDALKQPLLRAAEAKHRRRTGHDRVDERAGLAFF